MARGKYNIETIEAICRAISLTGKDKDGLKAGGICKNTFYQWLKTNKDFSDSVARARAFYRRSLWKADPSVRDMAIRGLLKHLRGDNEEWTTQVPDKEGKLVLQRKNTVKRLPTKWAIELVLGVNRDERETIEHVDFIEIK